MHTEHLFYFSPAIAALIRKATAYAKKILKEEVGFEVKQSRFIIGSTSYPIHIIAFEHTSRLGFFDSAFYEIGIHKIALFQDDLFLQELLRHELAHYLTYIAYGDSDTPHGALFHKTCAQYGWHKEKAATVPLDLTAPTKKREVLQKVEKLLSLSTSANVHESTAALERAQELLLKYDLSYAPSGEEFVVKRVLFGTKTSQKWLAISKMLREFGVYPVINHGNRSVYLELFGKPHHVEIGEHIAHFLNRELDALWKKEKALSGRTAKNSFVQGIAEGFTMKSQQNEIYQRALMPLTQEVEEHVGLAYPKLRLSQKGRHIDRKAHLIGKGVGKALSIPKGIATSACHKLLSLLP